MEPPQAGIDRLDRSIVTTFVALLRGIAPMNPNQRNERLRGVIARLQRLCDLLPRHRLDMPRLSYGDERKIVVDHETCEHANDCCCKLEPHSPLKIHPANQQ